MSRKRGRASNCQKVAEWERFLVWYSELDKRGHYRPKHAAEMFADETGIVARYSKFSHRVDFAVIFIGKIVRKKHRLDKY